MKNELRRLKTKEKIMKTLLSLLDSHSLKEISVKEICDVSDINRATFYRHFLDIYDLFEAVEKDLVAQLSPAYISDEDLDTLVNLIYDHQGFYREFFKAHLKSDYITGLIESCLMAITEESLAKGACDEESIKTNLTFMIHGSTGILTEWIDQDCQKSPEKISSYLKTVFSFFRPTNLPEKNP